jgi:hypothetical protein
MHASEELLHHYQVLWSKQKDNKRKTKGNYDGQRWTTWLLWKEGVKSSDICWLPAICRKKAPV